MEQFQTAVKNALKKHNLTFYRLSDLSGIERTHLLKIINGQRSISPPKLETLLKYMDLTVDEDRVIRLAYIDMCFGLEKFDTYRKIFLRGDDNADSRSSDSDGISISASFNDAVTQFNSHSELIKSLYAVTSFEMQSGENKRIYTNLDESITAEIFDSLGQNHDNIDIRQIITTENESDYSKTVGTAVEFMKNGYKVYYSNSVRNSDNYPDIPFPYYYITNELCVFASYDLTRGVVTKNKRFADIYAQAFLSAANNMTSIVSLSEDIMDIKEKGMEAIPYTEKTAVIVESNICTTLFMTLDMWDQIAKQDVPNRNFLRDTTYRYYQAIFQSMKKSIYIHSYEGLHKFTDEGIVFEMPAEYADPMSVKNRIAVYKIILQHYENNENHDFHLTKKGVFKTDIAIDLTDRYSDRKYVTSHLYGFLLNFMGNSFISINDTDINNEILDFINYLTVSPYLYSKEESLNILKDEIKRLEYML